MMHQMLTESFQLKRNSRAPGVISKRIMRVLSSASFPQALRRILAVNPITRLNPLQLSRTDSLVKRLNLSELTHLTSYLKGRRIPSTERIVEIAHSLQLTSIEEQFLMLLAARDRAVVSGDEPAVVQHQVRIDALLEMSETEKLKLLERKA